ncbi:BadF/BadG/BcrA/BcrD ATPase family protein [Tatumella ptyseos]|uniref:BadF/BadG/BcrA/BcrD ATPase family protein n=1 Tax=Tatumella ptyseos TaxID=82987 RepID=UPI0026EF9021|nr:BadF/BadG/BcrA/BcrD ATPase family protein [Tatumella ptyseos]WKX27094.1 BadF/BadG/BcrA/BcrD ATPase family protein [Tatumella ptyseos]
MSTYRIGIDGGGTHCRGRLVDSQGNLLAECRGGTGNVYSHFESALTEVESVVNELFTLANLSKSRFAESAMVAGLAGANVPSVLQRLEKWCIPGLQHKIVSDVETACFGAHHGRPGAIFICGTGSQGAVWNGQYFQLIGGWGFMLSDLASGAVLGQRALRLALLAHEGIIDESSLTQYIMSSFKHDAEKMLLWTQQARPKDWAQYAKYVFDYAQCDDYHGVSLVRESAKDAELMINTLLRQTELNVALLGGITEPLEPWLSADIRRQLVQPKSDALAGAILMAEKI